MKTFHIIPLSVLLISACASPVSQEAKPPSESAPPSLGMPVPTEDGAVSSVEEMIVEDAGGDGADVEDGTERPGDAAMGEESVGEGMTPRVIVIAAENWSFTPSAIRVKKGEKVQLQIAGISGVHGMASDTLGINVNVGLGETVSVDLPTESAGTHTFYCSVPCGPGHRDMQGTIVIEE